MNYLVVFGLGAALGAGWSALLKVFFMTKKSKVQVSESRTEFIITIPEVYNETMRHKLTVWVDLMKEYFDENQS